MVSHGTGVQVWLQGPLPKSVHGPMGGPEARDLLQLLERGGFWLRQGTALQDSLELPLRRPWRLLQALVPPQPW